MANADLRMFMDDLKKLIHSNHRLLINHNPLISSKKRRFKLLYQQDSIDLFLSALHLGYGRLSGRSGVFKTSLDLLLSALHLRNTEIPHEVDAFNTPLDLKKILKSIKSIKKELKTINIGNMKMDSPSRIRRHVKSQSVANAAGTSYTRNPLGIKKPSEEFVVGLYHDVEIIRDKLTEDTKQLCVVSIVGMGGLGKTTLATKLFNDPFLKYHFHIRAWATISQAYIKRDFLIQILTSIGVQEDFEKDDDSKLMRSCTRS